MQHILLKQALATSGPCAADDVSVSYWFPFDSFQVGATLMYNVNPFALSPVWAWKVFVGKLMLQLVVMPPINILGASAKTAEERVQENLFVVLLSACLGFRIASEKIVICHGTIFLLASNVPGGTSPHRGPLVSACNDGPRVVPTCIVSARNGVIDSSQLQTGLKKQLQGLRASPVGS